jgi:formylmethanofuran dehydrogenase subunit A
MVTIERAIIEAFRYSTKMGYQTALTAARTALKERKTSEKRLNETARQLGLWSVMIKNWEAITTE